MFNPCGNQSIRFISSSLTTGCKIKSPDAVSYRVKVVLQEMKRFRCILFTKIVTQIILAYYN
ncbi:MAG: hypothetical protein ACTSVX_10270 [Promethearchaeota archaeon]